LLIAIHFFEDQYRAKNIRGSPAHNNLWFFLWVQFIHIALILFFSPLRGEFIEEKIVVLAVLLVLVTHFTSIIIYYTEKLFYQGDANRLGGKYYLMIDRLVVFGCLLLPGYFWALIFLVFIGKPLFYKILKTQGYTQLNIILSNLFSIILGGLGRLVVY